MNYPIIKFAPNPKPFSQLAQCLDNPLIGENEYYLGLIIRAALVYTNKNLKLEEATRGFIKPNSLGWIIPDFIVFSKNETWAFELDEPYSRKDNNPIHYIGKDNERDNILNDLGIHVIRISEFLVFDNPEGLKEGIIKVLNGQKTGLIFDKSTVDPLWTKNEARDRARQKYRDHYSQIKLSIFKNRAEILSNFEDIKLDFQKGLFPIEKIVSFIEEVDIINERFSPLYPGRLKEEANTLKGTLIAKVEKEILSYNSKEFKDFKDFELIRNEIRKIPHLNRDLGEMMTHILEQKNKLQKQKSKDALIRLLMARDKVGFREKLYESYQYETFLLPSIDIDRILKVVEDAAWETFREISSDMPNLSDEDFILAFNMIREGDF